MAIRTKTQFETLYGTTGTVFPDNTTGEISESDVRAFGQDIADSFALDSLKSATASGTDTYTATITGVVAYNTHDIYEIIFTNANTGSSTININSLGAQTLKKSVSTNLASGDILAGQSFLIVYDGTNFQIIGIGGGGGGGGTWGSITGTLSAQTDLQSALDAKLALAGGAMTGAINEAQGSNIASASTTDIGAATGNSVTVTGTTTITGLGTIQAGSRRIVTFAGILTLTHNGTSLILPTAANITTAVGDVAEFVSLGSGNWKCTNYQRADGSALLGGGLTTDQEDQLELAYLRSIYYLTNR